MFMFPIGGVPFNCSSSKLSVCSGMLPLLSPLSVEYMSKEHL